MNRLRGRKKAKEEPVPRPSIDSDTTGPFKMFGRSKKPVEEPKTNVDLTTALPPSDDFRTSLLMTGLSARFSMLREQDDPNSKLGKASDDSVLYPKRQSRMDFGLNTGLHDIAEDSSVKHSSFARMDSFQSSDDGASTSGSVMNRGKPIEGNNLFGGRQKIYKITASGGSGRALYEDDVAQSSFQKWRKAEKEKTSLEDDQSGDVYNTHSQRPESPPQDFSRRRETSSTTSSAPSAARNSTAATSVTSSQPAPSLKDWQPPSATTPTSATSTHFLDRSVTRTRRLYEQTLNQDLQDQQSSALSRIDTLSRQRHFSSNRTPDLPHNASSPTTATAAPQILSKASAPNLRSFSPPASGSPQPSPSENGPKFPSLELTLNHTASPPLSPPISETEDNQTLPIGPGDRGKATAMGFFNRPAQQYDETRYAQRQRQLQQGRDTPTSGFRPESNVSDPATRSRSSSSLNRAPFEKVDSAIIKTEPTVQEESVKPTFLDFSDEDEDGVAAPLHSAPSQQEAPQVMLDRPDDHEHPALRKSALPTPLSLSSKTSEDASEKAQDISPEDSPTLGPGSGLSGMVRQHLRNVSTASSIYGGAQEEQNNRASVYGHGGHTMDQLVVDSNPWESGDGYGEYNREVAAAGDVYADDDEPGAGTPRETDEFARQLADGASRVRERLTTYVESDHSRSASPSVPHTEQAEDLPPPRPNAFSAFRSMSRRASPADSHRERSRSRPAKASGIGHTDAPSPRGKPHFDATDSQHGESGPMAARKTSSDGASPAEKEGNVHAGLKAFRQARRELQKMKEVEVQQRYQAPQAPQYAPPAAPHRERSSGQSQDRGPPPVSYNRIPSDGPTYTQGSRPGSRPDSRPGSRPGSRAPSERDRSGSETSNGSHPHYRPRLRTTSSAYDEPSPADMRRSPMMPPYSTYGDAGYNSRPGSAAGGQVSMSVSTPNLHSSPSAAPPLPPINPRRKGMGSPLPRDDDAIPGRSRIPLSSNNSTGGRGPHMMPDEETGPAQYRQRLRKVPSEANGVALRGRAERTNPPYGAPRPPPGPNVAGSHIQGGMI